MWAQTANSSERPPPARNAVAVPGFRRRFQGALREHAEFVCAFLRSPGTVGALCPSSRALARAMVAGSDLARADLVVELGPGTGAFTRVILESVGPQSAFVALELDERAVRHLRQRFTQLDVVHASAEQIHEQVVRLGRKHANYVVSGLPWAIIPTEIQKRIMTNVVTALAPGGVFTTFAYLHSRLSPSAVRYWRLLSTLFREVRVSALVWQNIPPAFVYRCVR